MCTRGPTGRRSKIAAATAVHGHERGTRDARRRCVQRKHAIDLKRARDGSIVITNSHPCLCCNDSKIVLLEITNILRQGALVRLRY